jgi:hypothetical protein
LKGMGCAGGAGDPRFPSKASVPAPRMLIAAVRRTRTAANA